MFNLLKITKIYHISDFSCSDLKKNNKSNLRKEEFILVFSLREQWQARHKAQVQEWIENSHIVSTVRD